MKKLIVIVMFLMIGLTVFTLPKATALSCAPPQPVQQEMERSSVVFKGKATEIKSVGLIVFQVEKAWKGIDSPIIEVYDNGWDPFTIGADYLVFANQRDGKLKTNLCGRTGPWDKAQEDSMKETKIEPTLFKAYLEAQSIKMPAFETEKHKILTVIKTFTIVGSVVVIMFLIYRILKRKKQN